MRIFITAVSYVLFVVLLTSCSLMGLDNTSAPIIATHSGDDVSAESDASFIELSKPSWDVSHESSADDSSAVFDESSQEEPSAPVVEPADRPYFYNGFTVCGFSEEYVDDVLTKIKSSIGKVSANVSVYYEDLESGAWFSYDGERPYKSGSVTKAPYAFYLIKSGVDLEEKLTLKASDKMDGSGSLKNRPVGGEYSVRELIEYSVRESDNTAYKMLYNRFGFEGFNEYCFKLGVSVTLSIYDVWGDLTADDAAVLFKEFYNAADDHTYDFFMTALKTATYSYLLPSGVGGTAIAHKYGYMSGIYKVLHDVGIVYTDSPYIVAVMTDFDPTGGNGRTTFTEISAYIKAFAG